MEGEDPGVGTPASDVPADGSVATRPGPVASNAPGAGYSPATVLHQAPPSVQSYVGARSIDRPDPRFNRFGRSPLPHLAVAAATSGVAYLVTAWMSDSTAGGGDGPPARLSRSVWAVALQGESVTTGGNGTRVWLAVGAIAVAAIAIIVWVRRVGQNTRHEKDKYGVFFALAALPQWFWLPLVLPGEGAVFADRSDALLRYSFALLMLLVQIGVARFVFTHRMWRSGGFRFEALAALLWAPLLATGGWVFAATCFTLVEVGDDGRGSSAWRPTDLHADLARWSGRLSYIGIIVVLVVVSALQHIGLAKDRADDVAFHEALARE